MWQIHEIVPHAGVMSLLDEVYDIVPGGIKTSIRISEDSLFFETGKGMPAWVGIEYMAQTIAAYVGIVARKTTDKPRPGFLLGSRNYHNKNSNFLLGTKLIIHAAEEWVDEQMGVFSCDIQSDQSSGEALAQARLVVFQPDNINNFIGEDLK